MCVEEGSTRHVQAWWPIHHLALEVSRLLVCPTLPAKMYVAAAISPRIRLTGYRVRIGPAKLLWAICCSALFVGLNSLRVDLVCLVFSKPRNSLHRSWGSRSKYDAKGSNWVTPRRRVLRVGVPQRSRGRNAPPPSILHKTNISRSIIERIATLGGLLWRQ